MSRYSLKVRDSCSNIFAISLPPGSVFAAIVVKSSFYVALKQRMRSGRSGFEFRMINHADKPGMRRQFKRFNQITVSQNPAEYQSGRFQSVFEFIIQLSAVMMSFRYFLRSVY